MIKPGRYLAEPLSWQLNESTKSQAMWLEVTWLPYESLDGEKGEVDLNLEAGVSGPVFFVRADGTDNVNGVETLNQVLGWKGSLKEFQNGEWKPPKCQITVEEETYNGRTRMRVAFVNKLDGTGPRGRMTDERVNELEDKFGDRFKKIIAGEASPSPKLPSGEEIPF